MGMITATLMTKAVYAESTISEIEEYKGLQSAEMREILITEDERKSYMSYTAITNKSSPQYKMQLRAKTDEITGIRMIGDRYCVACGSGISDKIGTYLDVTLESGAVIDCIVGDVKADRHTRGGQCLQGLDGSTIEFIVDTKRIPEEVEQTGDLSSISGWEWKVTKITVCEM